MNNIYKNSNATWIKYLIMLLLFLGLVYPTLSGFEHLLDDTFIHLRYAKNYINTGKIFYNQGQPSFGTSSLFYLFYISSILRFFNEQHWPLVIKLSSILAQVISILIAVNIFFGVNNQKLKIKQLILFLFFLLFLFCVPSTTRWLQDGMETSIGVLFAFLSIYCVTKFKDIKDKWWSKILLALIIVLPGILRLDLIPVVFSSIILLFLIENNKFNNRLLKVCAITILVLVVWLFINYLFFNAITPDSAIAKQSGKIEITWILIFIKSMLSASPFWLGSFLITFLLISANEISIKFRLILIVGLLPIIAQILAGIVFGQFIHGARYFLPTLSFQIATIFLVLNKNNYLIVLPKINKKYNYLIIFLILVTTVHTGILWQPINRVTEKTYLSLPNFLKEPGIKLGVKDIGQIGWYTNAEIIDLSALVNGRELAATNVNFRVEKLISKMGFPDYLILKQEDLDAYKISSDEIALTQNNDTKYYLRTNHLIMRMHNIDRSLDWFLWKPKYMVIE